MPQEPDSWVKRVFGGMRRLVLLILTTLVLIAVLCELRVPDQVWNIIAMVYAFYFGSKGAEYVQDLKELIKDRNNVENEKAKREAEKKKLEEEKKKAEEEKEHYKKKLNECREELEKALEKVKVVEAKEK